MTYKEPQKCYRRGLFWWSLATSSYHFAQPSFHHHTTTIITLSHQQPSSHQHHHYQYDHSSVELSLDQQAKAKGKYCAAVTRDRFGKSFWGNCQVDLRQVHESISDSWLHYSINHPNTISPYKNPLQEEYKEDTGTSNNLLAFFPCFYCNASYFLLKHSTISAEEAFSCSCCLSVQFTFTPSESVTLSHESSIASNPSHPSIRMSEPTETSPLLSASAEPVVEGDSAPQQEPDGSNPSRTENLLRSIKILQIVLFTSAFTDFAVAIGAFVLFETSVFSHRYFKDKIAPLLFGVCSLVRSCFTHLLPECTLLIHKIPHRHSSPPYSLVQISDGKSRT